MEILTATVSIIFLLGLILTPILLFVGVKKWNRFKFEILIYLALALIITAGIMGAFAWCARLLLDSLTHHYAGYFDSVHQCFKRSS